MWRFRFADIHIEVNGTRLSYMVASRYLTRQIHSGLSSACSCVWSNNSAGNLERDFESTRTSYCTTKELKVCMHINLAFFFASKASSSVFWILISAAFLGSALRKSLETEQSGSKYLDQGDTWSTDPIYNLRTWNMWRPVIFRVCLIFGPDVRRGCVAHVFQTVMP